MRKTSKKLSVKARARSFGYAGEGLRAFFRSQPNAWIHLCAAMVAVGLGIWLHISAMEWAVVAISIGSVLAAELFNSAIEYLTDHVTPERHSRIKAVKDMAAAAVLVVSLAALAVGLIIFLPKLFT